MNCFLATSDQCWIFFKAINFKYINDEGNVASDTIECDNPSYNDTLNTSKKNAFVTYASKVLSNATEEYVADKLINNTTAPIYYAVATLMGND